MTRDKVSRGGYSLIIVLVLFVVLLSACAIITLTTRQTMNALIEQQLSATSFYAAREAADVAIAAMFNNGEDNNLFKDIPTVDDAMADPNDLNEDLLAQYYPTSDHVNNVLENKYGAIDAKMTVKARKDPNLRSSTYWVILYIEVQLEDPRLENNKNGLKNPAKYYYKLEIDVNKPTVRNYNLDRDNTIAALFG